MPMPSTHWITRRMGNPSKATRRRTSPGSIPPPTDGAFTRVAMARSVLRRSPVASRPRRVVADRELGLPVRSLEVRPREPYATSAPNLEHIRRAVRDPDPEPVHAVVPQPGPDDERAPA